LNEIQRLTFPGPKRNDNFTKATIMKPNEEKCLLSLQPTSLTFSLLSDRPEKCRKLLAATFSRCFLLPPPGQVKTFPKNKTPGSDGLTVEFYLAFWHVVAKYLEKSLNFSHQHGHYYQLRKSRQ